ncbi:Outer membrane receptor proteins, mostly Fe transport [Spirosomataceae bacterium TFI 002]|nr:Outer membrane receptor proteins, mostly Fe transport [Spirosomataceae bacterium TFI 002]
MKKLLFITILLTLGKVNAQVGKVLDQKNQPIIGALIQNVNQGSVVMSNDFGQFSLSKYVAGDTLKAFLLGYETVQNTFSNGEEIRFVLKESSVLLESVNILPEMDAINVLADINLAVNPVSSSQELLRYVPGLFIGQHAGGGKAEQIFLRGFDIDHGTDLSINVDNMPVNMVSHAHGQGYSDLHFVIPETIDNIEFAKGSYKADKGNFTTAGSVDFRTKDRVDKNSIGIEAGQYNHKRVVGQFGLNMNPNSNTYLATEYLYNDGPFISPQNLNRFNAFVKHTERINNKQKLSLSASHFNSKWDASGQIPVRAVENGSISRFGAIDDTEGGNTSRSNAQAAYFNQLSSTSFFESSAYYTNYNFLLYSNFTFFAENPEDGDQIRQKENRNLFGFKSTYGKSFEWNENSANINLSTGFRNDIVRNNELSRTKDKNLVLNNIYLGDIDETNAYLNLDLAVESGKFSVIPGLRLDFFRFSYLNSLENTQVNEVQTKSLLSPKLNFIYQSNKNTQFFFKTGLGYHSNDTRGVIARSAQEILPRSVGADLGSIFKPTKALLFNVTAWYLYLQQEFVYVGDEGIVEPSGRTSRMGVDLSLRAQVSKKVFFNSDLTYTNARSIDEPAGANFIPLAPKFTMSNGISVTDIKGFSAGLRSRMLGDRAANEDNSIVAEGYFVTDANLNYQWGRTNLGLEIQNLFNTTWNETQFATTSRLRNEANPIEEIHFTPGTPFNARLTLRVGI